MDSNRNCWYCGAPLIWQSDYTFAEVKGQCCGCKKNCCYGIATVLVCSGCGATVDYSRSCDEHE